MARGATGLRIPTGSVGKAVASQAFLHAWQMITGCFPHGLHRPMTLRTTDISRRMDAMIEVQPSRGNHRSPYPIRFVCFITFMAKSAFRGLFRRQVPVIRPMASVTRRHRPAYPLRCAVTRFGGRMAMKTGSPPLMVRRMIETNGNRSSRKDQFTRTASAADRRGNLLRGGYNPTGTGQRSIAGHRRQARRNQQTHAQPYNLDSTRSHRLTSNCNEARMRYR